MDSNQKYIVISGSPGDGFRFYGPFDDFTEANDFISDNGGLRDDSWWVDHLENPE